MENDRETFERLLDEMQASVISYGYNKLLEYDMKHAKGARDCTDSIL